jgi:hypothetical protein
MADTGSTGWDWSHPIDSISNWIGKKEDDASNWVKGKITAIAKSAGESAMQGLTSAMQSGTAGLGSGASTGDGSSSSDLASEIGALLGAKPATSTGSPSTATGSSGGSASDSGLPDWLTGIFGGKSSSGSSGSTPDSGQQQSSSDDSSGGLFGGGIMGLIIGILALVVVSLLAGAKGLMGLFGMGSDAAPASPDDNIFQRGIKKVEHIGHEAYQWMGEKIDNIAGARGIQNNNPGNIIKSGHHWQGEITGSDSRFVTFRTAAEGTQAMGENLLAYDKQGLNTINKIINTWAPSSDGNNVNAYASLVSQRMGVGADETLNLHDPKTLASLMKAMATQENGKVPYPPELYVWAANAALNPSQAGQAPMLVAQDNGKYAMQHVDQAELMAANYTPPQSSATGGGPRKPIAAPAYSS